MASSCRWPHRRAYRHGKVAGEVTLGGRRILVPRLRARSIDGAELVLPSFAYAAGRDPLDARTLDAIAVGVSTREYGRVLDPLPAGQTARAVAKSSVSRRFVAFTRARLTAWLAQPLDGLDVRVVLIDGLHFREHVILLALGIAADGHKHVLALRTPDGGYGCIVRNKASEICIDIRKQPAGTDAGPNAPNGTPNAGDFLCYKAKCFPRLIDRPIDVTDQFGARQITVKFFAGPRKVCTPILSKPVE